MCTGLWSHEEPLSSHHACGGKKKRGGGRDWELWPKKRDFIKRGGRKEKAVPAAAASEHFSSAEQRQESVVVDVEWLNRPGRGRKVQKGTSIPVPIITPHFVHRQAHYLISLDALLRGRSLSELKANLQGPCCLGNRREIKWYQFWNMVKDAATRWMSLAEKKKINNSNKKSQRILLMIHHTDS